MRTGSISLVAAISLLIGASAAAGDFDGKHDLVWTSMQIFECHPDQDCSSVLSEECGAASQFVLDFGAKTLDSVADTPQVSRIERSEVIDDQLFVQGIEDGSKTAKDGAAWSFAISDPSGVMVATVAKGDGTAFVIQGFCDVKD